MKKLAVVMLSVLFVVLLLAGATTSLAADPLVSKIHIIPLDTFSTGAAGFDIGWVDSGTYYLAERTVLSPPAGRIEIINAIEDESEGFIPGFVGTVPAAPSGIDTRGSRLSGPNGIVVIAATHWKRELWAGDGDSTVKVVDLQKRVITDTISTGGLFRADEISYDPIHRIIIVGNDLESVGGKPPFVTFIDQKTHQVLGKILYDGSCTTPSCAPHQGPQATGGVEMPIFHGRYFYLSVPEVGGGVGEIDVIDPVKMQIVKRFPGTTGCYPAGLTHGPGHDLLPGCDGEETIIMDDRDGTILAHIPQVSGADQVWYNPGDNRYYIAANACNTDECKAVSPRSGPGYPVLGVIDASKRKWIENVPTGGGAHSVAVNPWNNHVFVPIATDKGVAVFEPADKDKDDEELDCHRACEKWCRGEDRDHRERDHRDRDHGERDHR